jgi:Protein of unknown function (DUF1176)
MSLRTLPLLLLAAASFGTPAMAKVDLGAQKFFKDWAVACDNTLSCEAIALEPESFPNGGLSLSVSRNAATGAAQISLSGFETRSDRYRIFIDGRFVDSGAVVDKNAAAITVTGTDAIKLARAITKGVALMLDDGKGGELGKASLLGSTAALRHIDATQNRAGTSNALAAPGRRKLRAKSLPKPVIEAKRIAPNNVTPDATTLVSLVESSGCAQERYGVTEDTAYSLGPVNGKAQALVMISCGSGAYNFSHAVYLGIEENPGKWAFKPARFDHGEEVRTMDKTLQLVVNADWDPASQRLSSHAKGRGIGDCGNAETYVWDGAMFRLVAAHGMSECRGSVDWLTLWQADVKLVD